MFMEHTDGNCLGCGLPKSKKDECTCEWETCQRCGAWDCWINKDGYYACRHCDYHSDPNYWKNEHL